MAVIPGEGTVLSVNGIDVAFVTSINGYSSTVAAIETTHLTTPGARTYRAGKRNNEPVSGEGWFDPDDESHAALEELLDTRASAAITITYLTETPTVYSFDAILTSFSVTGVDNDNNVTFSFEFQPSGDIVKSGGATGSGSGGG